MDLPICDVCGERVVATLCGVRRPMTPESQAAISAVLLAAHKRLAGHDEADR